MRLDQVKLVGFKSFVDATTINFSGSFCSIVGSNGCGKSNIVDALRWALGEVSAKQLRGEVMDDVVFNGSENRAPVGLASVELTLDNTEGRLGSSGLQQGFSKIVARRTLSRNGLSEYYINDSHCRRRDVLDLFASTGLGPRSYAVIEQGMIARLIEARPEDLRAIIEDASGIARYKERRRESENRMRKTHENLLRLADIRHELEREIKSLQRQARAAKKYQSLRADLRRHQAESQALQWLILSSEIDAKQRRQSQIDSEVEHQLAVRRGIEAELEAMRLDRDKRLTVYEAIQRELYETGSKTGALEQDIAFRRRRAAQIDEELERGAAQIQEITTYIESDTGAIDAARPVFEKNDAELQASRVAADQASARLTRSREALSAWEIGRDRPDSLQSQVKRKVAELQHLRGREEALVAVFKDLVGDEGEAPDWLNIRGLSAAPRLGMRVKLEAGWEPAFDAALGFMLKAVLVDSIDDFLAELQDFDEGELTLIESALPAEQLTSAPDGLRPLADKVLEPRALLAGLLAGCYACEDLQTALKVRQQLRPGQRIVTRNGLIVAFNWIWAQSEGKRGGLLQRSSELRELASSIEKCAGELSELEAVFERERSKIQSDFDQALRVDAEQRELVHRLDMHANKLKAERVAAEQRMQRSNEQLQRLSDHRKVLEKDSVENQGPIEELAAKLDAALLARAEVERRRDIERAALDEIDETIRVKEAALREAIQEQERLREVFQSGELQNREAELKREQVARQIDEAGFESQALLADMLAERPPEEALLRELAEDIARRVDVCEQALRQLGSVNFAADEDCAEREERKQHLDIQNQELEQSMRSLREAIARIDSETRTRFGQTFAKVNENLAEFFPKLFGGGQASLALTEEELLNAGLEFMARPPGKRNTRISTLSGGEKALAAIALLFSIFKLNPAPFCVFDEVDAALDDINVARFVEMVRELSSMVQFICITHNKITMEASDSLVGVTMRTPGVSSLYSLNIEEAVRLLQNKKA